MWFSVRLLMSAKWRQVKAWDDQFLRGPFLWPLKVLVRAFSSITLAVTLLSFVMVYGTMASVPLGLLALAPTYLLLGAIAVVLAGAIAGALGWCVVAVGSRLTARGTSGGAGPKLAWFRRPVLVVALLVAVIISVIAAALVWRQWLWPMLHYNPGSGAGLRLFAAAAEQYKSTTLRRLPGIEMSELEFYAWWPLRVVLLLFVVNMVVATVRRIEFTFKNLGVLTVHTGIVMLAMGSIYYSGLKREGDTILLAGQADAQTGVANVGPPQTVFFDNTRVALYIDAGMGWEQRPLPGLPRYNDYNLQLAGGKSALETAGRLAPWKTAGGVDRLLSLKVPPGDPAMDPGVSLRVVGYCAFAQAQKDHIQKPASLVAEENNPLRIVYLHSQLPDDEGRVSDSPILAFTLTPKSATDRLSEQEGSFALEYTAGPRMGMSDQRWMDLTEPLESGTEYALVVELPAPLPFRAVYPVKVGSIIEVGGTGYRIEVKALLPTPPFPIITEGYKGATSSVAQIAVTPPSSQGPTTGASDPFDRYVYHRFPEINQDMLAEVNESGMPKRRDADPSIRIGLIDASQLNVYIDDAPGPSGLTRALIRERGGRLRVVNQVGADGRLDQVVDKISLRVGERWENAREVVRPSRASDEDIRKDADAMGTHDKAMIAVEVSAADAAGVMQSDVVWLAYTKYFGLGPEVDREVKVAGKQIALAFGRVQHPLPGFALQLLDFKMLTYDHRGSPRDYQSLLRVSPTEADFTAFEHVTQLNAPLTAPFLWDESGAFLRNVLGRARAGLNPNQYKFSQAGWDAAGWARTQRLTDEGTLKKPVVSFTILGVGNSPGIHVIALGGVLMGLGIPWAFYVKPWLVRREKTRIQQALAEGTYVPKRPKGGQVSGAIGAGTRIAVASPSAAGGSDLPEARGANL